MNILVLNAGSSSQKSSLYQLADSFATPKAYRLPADPISPLWEGFIDWTYQAGVATVKVKTARGATWQQEIANRSQPEVLQQMLNTLWQGDTQVIDDPSAIAIVGHRVVHGGQRYWESTWITAAVKQAIADFAEFAPVHNPANLQGIVAIEHILGPSVPQVAVFDTAFHAQMPPTAATYAIPYAFYEQGIRKYGFHGISHQFVATRAAHCLGKDLADLRLITCHLGNGCSLAAIAHGQCVDTTMGFTPLAGLMMGTRSGDIDPGILLHLMRNQGYTVDDLDRLLNQESGLKGVSGLSNDLRQIRQAIAAGHERAQLAYDLYIYRLRALISALLPALGGLDALVFTAGVGENSVEVRADVCAGLEFLGLRLDRDRNQQNLKNVSLATPDSTVQVLVIPTQEDWAIAQTCWQLAQTL
ncbi:acetate/propionate family kinase [Trichothermofontia sp.]